MKIKYSIKEVKPKIFLAEFEDTYDLCMTFLRYQEFYESPNPKFRNKHFKFFDFMKWYSFQFGNQATFTYANDWVGFNIPSDKLLSCQNQVGDDWNQYDDVMYNIVQEIQFDSQFLNCKPQKYYLIGATKGNERTIKHEVAHGLFYLNKSYKKEMLNLVKALPAKFRNQLYKDLAKVGYTEQVFPDEAQAFLSTGWRDYFTSLNGEDKPFVETFNKYYNK